MHTGMAGAAGRAVFQSITVQTKHVSEKRKASGEKTLLQTYMFHMCSGVVPS